MAVEAATSPIERARQLGRMGDFNGVVSVLNDILRSDPTNIEGLFLLGAACFKLNLYSRAREAWSRVLRIHPNHEKTKRWLSKIPQAEVSYLLNRARMLGQSGDFKGVIRACNELLNIYPNNLEGQFLLGGACYKLKSYGRARDAWLKVLEIDPTNEKAKRWLKKLPDDMSGAAGVESRADVILAPEDSISTSLIQETTIHPDRVDIRNRKSGEILRTVEGNTLENVDLAGAELRYADLRKVVMIGANFYAGDLTRANMTESNLSEANLRSAILTEVDLSSAVMRGANLVSAFLRSATLSDANLGGADLTRAVLGSCNLDGANLRQANLTDADLCMAVLTEANLSETNMEGVDLSSSFLRGANLSGANLSGANLTRVNLSNANLEGANLEGARLRGAFLRAANLNNANLEGADLTRANLGTANLENANLAGANLTDANMEGTLLIDANLAGARITGVDLKEADLTGANLENTHDGEGSEVEEHEGTDPMAAAASAAAAASPTPHHELDETLDERKAAEGEAAAPEGSSDQDNSADVPADPTEVTGNFNIGNNGGDPEQTQVPPS